MFAQHISWKIENRERQKDMLRDTAPPTCKSHTVCLYSWPLFIYIYTKPKP